MAMRPRTPTFRAQPSVRRVYETLQPKSEMRQNPEAYLLHVSLPGYTRARIKITYVSSSRSVRISGERPIQGNRWSRFDQTYPLPENCEAEKLQGKFEFGTLILTMPKKTISQVFPKQEVKTTQEKDQPGPSDKPVPENAKPEKVQETIPTQYTTQVEETVGDKKSASLPGPVKGSPSPSEKAIPEKAQETIPFPPQFTTTKVEEPIGDKKSASLPGPVKGSPSPSEKAIPEKAKPEKTQETIPFPPQFTSTKVDEPIGDKKSASLPSPVKSPNDWKLKAQKRTQEDTSERPTEKQKQDEKVLRDLIPQKGQEETVKRPILTAKPEKGLKGNQDEKPKTEAIKTLTNEKPQKEFEPKPIVTAAAKIQRDEKPQKDHQEKVEPKPTLTTVTRDKEEKGQEKIRLKSKLSTIEKQLEEKTVDEDAEERVSKKEVRGNGKPYNMEKAIIKEKDSRTSDVTPKELAEPSGVKVPEKGKEDMIECVGSIGIRELAISACQVVTRIAEGKLNEEEKHLVANIGAAVLVLAALGVYTSYRFASSG